MSDDLLLLTGGAVPPLPTPPVPLGEVHLLASWCEIVDEPIYFPVYPEPYDWFITVLTPLGSPSDTVDVQGMVIRQDGYGATGSTLQQEVALYKVLSVTSAPMLEPTGKCQLFIAAYRGLASNERVEQFVSAFQYDDGGLGMSEDPIQVNVAAAQQANITYTNIHPDLGDIYYYAPMPPMLHTHTLESTSNPAIATNRRVGLQFFSGPTNGYLRDNGAYTNGYLDPEIEDAEGWGSAYYHTFVFGTQSVRLLPTDTTNPAPAGIGRVPAGTIYGLPLGIIDEEGNQLVDENDDTLIWR